MNTVELIRCTQCNEPKPLSEFSPNPRAKSGRQSICKSCQAAKISAGRKVSAKYPPSAFKSTTPKFEGMHPLQLIASMRELADELRDRGFTYKGELTYTNVIKI